MAYFEEFNVIETHSMLKLSNDLYDEIFSSWFIEYK